MRPHLMVEQRQLALLLKARGWSLRESARRWAARFRRWR
jgi:hypothetical protein